jgi:hypothetical protein
MNDTLLMGCFPTLFPFGSGVGGIHDLFPY